MMELTQENVKKVCETFTAYVLWTDAITRLDGKKAKEWEYKWNKLFDSLSNEELTAYVVADVTSYVDKI